MLRLANGLNMELAAGRQEQFTACLNPAAAAQEWLMTVKEAQGAEAAISSEATLA